MSSEPPSSHLKMISLKFYQNDLVRLDKHVENGEFKNKSEAIRIIIKEWLDLREFGFVIPALFEGLAKILKGDDMKRFVEAVQDVINKDVREP